MRVQHPHTSPRQSDAALIELLRVHGSQGIGNLSAALGVTATAVRQRLDRLMRQGLVARQAVGGRRGRPAHEYSLTDAGCRAGGDNFRDLAVVLWREIRGVRDLEVRRGLLGRIGSALAALHRSEVAGTRPAERLHGVADILKRRDIACAVESADASPGGLPVLTSYACPYPDLAAEDRGICVAERAMIEDLVGGPGAVSTADPAAGSRSGRRRATTPPGSRPAGTCKHPP